MKLNELLKIAIDKKCSDIILSVGIEAFGRRELKLEKITDSIFTQEQLISYSKEILGDNFSEVEINGEFNSSFSIPGLSRFRVNIYKQRNSYALSIRVIPFNPPNFDENNVLNRINDIVCNENGGGLVLITGIVGSGKTTTIASIIDYISKNHTKHIITIESTIEYLYKHHNSIVNQRELGSDTKTYITGIESALRENPDILVIDNIFNHDVLKNVAKCCEAGIIVISGMYANSVVHCVNNILDISLTSNNEQWRIQIANILKCIVNQKLILDTDNKKFCISEMLINTPAVSNSIKENKTKHIIPLMQNGIKIGMSTMDISLIEAYKKSKISKHVFLQNISNKELATKIILNY